MSTTTRTVLLSEIRTDGGTQMRARIDDEVINDYRDKMLAGVEFDHIDLFYDGEVYWVGDGFHRFYGAREAKLKEISARVHKGTQRDAILFACGANAKHGMRRTNADKRIAVETLLSDAEWVKWSDRKIADAAAVNQSTVSAIRRELMESISSPAAKSATAPRIGKDGKSRKPPTPRQQVADFFNGDGKDKPPAKEREPGDESEHGPIVDAEPHLSNLGKLMRFLDDAQKAKVAINTVKAARDLARELHLKLEVIKREASK